MKLRNLIGLFLFIGLIIGVWWFYSRPKPAAMPEVVIPPRPPARPPETPAEREARWLQEARSAFAAAITNELPGYKRTLRVEDTILADRPVSNWTASAAVEYVDKKGNFSRTTLFWKFTTRNDDIQIVVIPY